VKRLIELGGPLLQLQDVTREFRAGDAKITVLRNIRLDIHAGEFLAIMGISGSGKSTLLHILGCLDRPTSGTYSVAGRATTHLSADELAELRRDTFGFIFQRYHLLSDLTALGNVETPGIYAGFTKRRRRERAQMLLAQLGLSDRAKHKPEQLSGGQQQRVSVARALMNGGNIIVADEPTGALDRSCREEVLALLSVLHASGRTIILVTHDKDVASRCQRIVEIRDGQIFSDVRNPGAERTKPTAPPQHEQKTSPRTAVLVREFEAMRVAAMAMASHRLRTLLTMLGIIIGIAAVVSVIALGNGSREQILLNISALGTNTIDIYPGNSSGDLRSSRVQTLRAGDADILASQSYVDSATPNVASAVTARYRDGSVTVQVNGVGDQYFRVRGMKLLEGSWFDADAVKRLDQSVLIDQNTRAQLFGNARETPIGKTMLLGNVPCRVIGIVRRPASGFSSGTALDTWVPYSSAMARMLGRTYVSSITVRVTDATPMKAAEQAITKLLTLRHGGRDFFLQSSAHVRETVEATSRTLTLLIGAIAAISLVVGGIGVMNIMLACTSERVGEIGLRMAIGARQSDILQQFLFESLLVCLIGGALGVILSFAVGNALKLYARGDLAMSFSPLSIIAALLFSMTIGIAFGLLPARTAARLAPIEALTRE
jgi:macrolide transport system ATP-binding/permease protein